jgi:hypothetical protein
MEGHGLRICEHGVVVRTERRQGRRAFVCSRGRWKELIRKAMAGEEPATRRVRGFSEASRKRLEFIAANAGARFRSLLTLTYHAELQAGEDEAARNARVAVASKRDLNRFLSALRGELGAYLWVQEVQRRGVIHFHVLCEGEPSSERVAVAWCRATGELDDGDALRHAALVEPIESESAARWYVGRYLGKGRQKKLPLGVEKAGRWWGRSRGLALVVLDEVVTREPGGEFVNRGNLQIVRAVRRYLSGVFGWRFRSGAFVSWGGELTGKLQRIVGELRAFYGKGELVGVMARGVVGEATQGGGR